jgi:hypothetical protein
LSPKVLANNKGFNFSLTLFDNQPDKPNNLLPINGNPELISPNPVQMTVKIVFWMLSANAWVFVDFTVPFSQFSP